MAKLTRSDFLGRLAPKLREAGLLRSAPDSTEQVPRALLEAVAGLPSFEQLWAGDTAASLSVLAVLSGERVAGVDVARRAQLLYERMRVMAEARSAKVSALLLVVYERPVPAEERGFVIAKGARSAFLFGKARVATWVAALDEPAVHARPLPGWPAALAADQLLG